MSESQIIQQENSEPNEIFKETKRRHLFENLVNNSKKATVKLYSKVGFQNQILENKIKQFEENSEPFLNKITNALDNSIDKTLEKCVQIKFNLQRQSGENSTQIKMLSRWAIFYILNNLERQLQYMAKQANLVSKEIDLNPSLKDESITVTERTRQLAVQVSNLMKQLGNEVVQKLINQKIYEVYESALFEIQIYSEILQDVTIEMGQIVIEKSNQNYVVPFKKTVDTTQQCIVLAFNDLNKENIINKLKQNCLFFSNASLEFYQNYVNIKFTREFYEKNKKLIKQLLTTIKEESQKMIQLKQSQAIQLYEQSLQKLQNSKTVKNAFQIYQISIENLRQRKQEKINRQKKIE